MFKKTFLTLLFVLAGTLAYANGDAMPQILASLDSATENQLHMMTDSELSEVRGTGQNLPDIFAFREHFYDYNNYGATADYRSYIWNSTGGETGGQDFGNGGLAGERWLVQIYGTNYVAEERIKYIEQIGTTSEGVPVFYQETVASSSDWSRPWDGQFHVFYDYNQTW